MRPVPTHAIRSTYGLPASTRWLLWVGVCAWIVQWPMASLAPAQQRSAKDYQATSKSPRNILLLPSIGASKGDTTHKTKSLPSPKTPGRLASSIQIESEEELLIPDEANDSSNQDLKWEKVTPIPIKPTDDFDAKWLREKGEALPPKRELYDLPRSPKAQEKRDEPANQSPGNESPSKPTPPSSMEATTDAPKSLDIAPTPTTPAEDSTEPLLIPTEPSESQGDDSSVVYEDRSDTNYPAPRMYDWEGFGSLSPNLSQRLNSAEASSPVFRHTSQYSGDIELPMPEVAPHPTANPNQFGSLLQSQPPMAAPASLPNNRYHHLQKGILRDRVNNRLHPSYDFSGMPACAEPLGHASLGTASPRPYHPEDFAPTLVPDCPPNPNRELESYYGKKAVATQRPLVELWRPFYGDGIFSPAIPLLSDVNPLMPQFLLYGDYRLGAGVHRNVLGNPERSIANRLALDMDLRLTGTERIHGFMAPLDNNGQFTRLDFSDSRDVRFESEMDAQFETGFFEGDLGAIFGGLTGQDAPFDLPIAAGLMPLNYQNGIWMEDIVAGVAVALPWRHSRELNWANYDITFFALFDQVTSPAFVNNSGVANAFGTAWFIEAYDGYIEADYAYLQDRVVEDRSYHNTAIAYTRRYFERISNSIRLINNYGQDFSSLDRTADGTLLLFENSLVTSKATTVIPYANFFYGFRRPQSVARAAAAGGILRNTGINFETDNLTGFPTLDATGNNSYGGATGLNLFSSDFRQQFVVEFAALDTYGDAAFSTAAGPEYGFGTRYQKALTNWTLLRLDAMVGLRDNAPDLYGSRAEWRWKF